MKAKGNVRLILKNSILFSIAPFLPKVINVLLMPVMTMYLTDVDFGIYGTLTAYTGAISAFSVLGLGVVLMNSFYKYPDSYKDIWRQIYGFLSIWMIVYAVIQAALILIFCPEEARCNVWWIILLTNFSTVFFGPTATIGNAYYVYHKESVPIVWRSVMASVITIITDFVLIVWLEWGYMGWYVGGFAGTFFSNASYYGVVRRKMDIRPSYRINKNVIKQSLSVSLPTIPHYYTAYLLEGSGRMVLDAYTVPQGEIGRVSIAQQIGDLFSQGITGLNNAVSPFVMQAIKDGNDKRVRLIHYLFTAVVFSLAFVGSLWSKEIMALLISNESLSSAYKYLILYMMALCYRPSYLIVSAYFFYYEKTKQLLLVTFLSGLLAIAMYVLFVPVIGCWAFFIGHYIACLYYGYSGFLFNVYKENANNRSSFLLIAVVQLLLTAVAFFLVEYLVAKIIVTVIIIVLFLFLFKRNNGFQILFGK